MKRLLSSANPVLIGLALSSAAGALAIAQQQPQPYKEAELVAAGYKRLAAAEIRQKLVGNTSHVLQLASVPGAPAGIVYSIYYPNDRERVVRPAPGGGPKFTTLWWTEGDLNCGEEKAPGVPATHRCYALYDVGSLRYSCRQPDGLCAAAARTVPGNPDNL